MKGSLWRIEKTIDLDLSAERVCDYLRRWQTVAEWDPTVFAARQLTEGAPAAGSRFAVILRWGGSGFP